MIQYNLNNVTYRLREPQDLSWVQEEGHVFSVIDQTGSGCILFGIERTGRRYLYKIAGVQTVEAEVSPEESIRLLRHAVQVNRDIRHPLLCPLVRDFAHGAFYTAVYGYVQGDCLFDHWNFDHYIARPEVITPMQRFHALPVEKRLEAAEELFSFMQTVIDAGYLAVDFYDSSILYDFDTDRMALCDIDLFQKAPLINEAGAGYFGTTRLKAPEENEKGAVIDARTNLFTLGAILFDMFTELDPAQEPRVYPANVPERRKIGHFLPNARKGFELNDQVYEVLYKATAMDREQRFQTIQDFYENWRKSL
ncbi:MAG: hypothetical protein K6A77_09890 [Clostridiales bacterium]|nr:hypothetical protein [Clostridiales bacterium]